MYIKLKELPYTLEDANHIYWNSFESPQPLLEYVEAWAEEFCPSYDGNNFTDPETGEEKVEWYRVPSRAPGRFVSRLLRSEIKNIERCKQRYTEEAKELLAMLDAFGIDKDKYWYLCLIIKDYIEGFANGTKPLPSHSKVLKELIDKLDEMEPNEKNWKLGFAKHNAELTIKVEGNKGSFTTDDTTVLNIVNYALTNFYYDYCVDDNSIFHVSKFSHEKAKFSLTDKAFLFNKYMNWFLKDKKYKRSMTDSRSKDLLISRTLYVFDIIGGIKERLYDIDGMGNRALRDMIKNWADPSNKSHNEYYMFV